MRSRDAEPWAPVIGLALAKSSLLGVRFNGPASESVAPLSIEEEPAVVAESLDTRMCALAAPACAFHDDAVR